MAATPAPRATRYFQPGTDKVLLLTTVANLETGPTRAEINAGTDVTQDISGVTGWLVQTNQLPAPSMGSRKTGNVPGRITVDDSTISFYASKLRSSDIGRVIARDARFFVVFLNGGDVTTGSMDVYDTNVGSVGRTREMDALPTRPVSFSIDNWNEDLAIPALT